MIQDIPKESYQANRPAKLASSAEARQDSLLAAFAPLLAEISACLPRDPATGEFVAFGPESIAVKEALKRGYLTPSQAESMALKPEDPSGLDARGKPLERSDVVHDLLAHLAEQMMALHKAKQGVVREAHAWLEARSGLPVADWKLKTMVQKFHEKSEHDWKRALRDKGNRKRFRLGGGSDGGSAVGEGSGSSGGSAVGGGGGAGGSGEAGGTGGEAGWATFEAEALARLREATEELQPTLARIEATDWLIDQIVYRLYGLTEAEVAIVEG